MSFTRARYPAVLLSFAVCAVARADANINVDGNNGDWASVTTCFNEATGDGSGGIELSRACLENNNSSGNTGYLFALFESPSNLPTNSDSYFGFAIDKNDDGQITSADEAFAVFFPRRSGSTPDGLQVFRPVTYDLLRSYPSESNCGGPSGANGWYAIRNGRFVELRVAYGCLGLTAGDDLRLMQMGVYPAFDLTVQAYYDGSNNTLETAGPPPDVVGLVAISGQSQNRLVWTNPAQHDGVIILRATGSAPNTAPVFRRAYTAGETLGNAVVLYSDAGKSAVSKFTDTQNLVNGTRYYYRVYNHHQRYTYATGNVPSSLGVFSEPTSRSGTSPLWCYSMGLPSLQTPVTESGGAVMTSNNQGLVTGNVSSMNVAEDGNERWRPVQLAAAVQARAPLVPLVGRSGQYLLTGDQSGHAYLVESSTGSVLWTGNDGNPLGTRIQAQPATQLYNYASTAFRAAHGPPAIAAPRDLVFFGTRNGTKDNQVLALSSVDGRVVWTYSPGNLDIISGAMMVDYANDRLWVVARSNGNKQASVRVLDSITGAQVAALSLGDIDQSVTRDDTVGQIYVVNNSGVAYGIGRTTYQQVWSRSIGATSSYLWPMGGGFMATLKSGSVRRYSVEGNQTAELWSRSVANPSGLRLHTGMQRFFVGSSDGKIHQLDPVTGVDEKQLTVSNQAVGAPHIDTAFNRLHVGTLDGRLCSFQLPIP